MTRADIEDRLVAGGTIEVLKGPAPGDALPLAAVAPDGTVNLSPGARSPGLQDWVIALVGGNASGR